jgi:hypothetical protein
MFKFSEFKERVFVVMDSFSTPESTIIYYHPLEREFGNFVIPKIEMELLSVDKNDIELSKSILYTVYKAFAESINHMTGKGMESNA